MDIIWPGGAAAALTISFDDGYAATYESTVSSLQQRGMYATYHIIPERVGKNFGGLETAGWEQWGAAARLGHEIGCHGFDHSPMAGWLCNIRRLFINLRSIPERRGYLRQLLATMRALHRWQGHSASSPDPQVSRRSQRPDLVSARRQISQMLADQPIESFAYPYGLYNRAARDDVQAAGFTTARTLNYGLNTLASDPFCLRGVSLTSVMALSDLSSWIKRACEQGAWLVLVLHLVAEDNPLGYPYYCSVSTWQRLLDVLEQHSLWITTQSQAARHLLRTSHEHSHA